MFRRGIDVYKWARRNVRAALRRNPALDRTVGDALRWLEIRSPLGRALARDPVLARGVVRIGDITLHHRPGDSGVVGALTSHGEYEPETAEVIEQRLSAGLGFVDAGAHIGYFSVLAGRRVKPNGKVYAFEPIRENAALLRKNAVANGLEDVIDLVVSAVSAEVGTARFSLHPQSSVSHKIAAGNGGDTVEVPTVSLDAYFAERAWPPVHIVKLDVEGAELAAFRGMRELVQRNPSLAVIFELHVANLERMRLDGHALFDELRSLGFSRFWRLLSPVEEIVGPKGIDDALALARRANFNVLAERSSS